ncbi:hypothetical protein PENSPDRAFT_671793 [Peniophora sp. CONT]|nr:hypothetical protein PENSPDRAFT_671793 [Peniophora sp. CONT]
MHALERNASSAEPAATFIARPVSGTPPWRYPHYWATGNAPEDEPAADTASSALSSPSLLDSPDDTIYPKEQFSPADTESTILGLNVKLRSDIRSAISAQTADTTTASPDLPSPQVLISDWVKCSCAACPNPTAWYHTAVDNYGAIIVPPYFLCGYCAPIYGWELIQHVPQPGYGDIVSDINSQCSPYTTVVDQSSEQQHEEALSDSSQQTDGEKTQTSSLEDVYTDPSDTEDFCYHSTALIPSDVTAAGVQDVTRPEAGPGTATADPEDNSDSCRVPYADEQTPKVTGLATSARITVMLGCTVDKTYLTYQVSGQSDTVNAAHQRRLKWRYPVEPTVPAQLNVNNSPPSIAAALGYQSSGPSLEEARIVQQSYLNTWNWGTEAAAYTGYYMGTGEPDVGHLGSTNTGQGYIHAGLQLGREQLRACQLTLQILSSRIVPRSLSLEIKAFPGAVWPLRMLALSQAWTNHDERQRLTQTNLCKTNGVPASTPDQVIPAKVDPPLTNIAGFHEVKLRGHICAKRSPSAGYLEVSVYSDTSASYKPIQVISPLFIAFNGAMHSETALSPKHLPLPGCEELLNGVPAPGSFWDERANDGSPKYRVPVLSRAPETVWASVVFQTPLPSYGARKTPVSRRSATPQDYYILDNTRHNLTGSPHTSRVASVHPHIHSPELSIAPATLSSMPQIQRTETGNDEYNRDDADHKPKLGRYVDDHLPPFALGEKSFTALRDLLWVRSGTVPDVMVVRLARPLSHSRPPSPPPRDYWPLQSLQQVDEIYRSHEAALAAVPAQAHSGGDAGTLRPAVVPFLCDIILRGIPKADCGAFPTGYGARREEERCKRGKRAGNGQGRERRRRRKLEAGILIRGQSNGTAAASLPFGASPNLPSARKHVGPCAFDRIHGARSQRSTARGFRMTHRRDWRWPRPSRDHIVQPYRGRVDEPQPPFVSQLGKHAVQPGRSEVMHLSALHEQACPGTHLRSLGSLTPTPNSSRGIRQGISPQGAVDWYETGNYIDSRKSTNPRYFTVTEQHVLLERMPRFQALWYDATYRYGHEHYRVTDFLHSSSLTVKNALGARKTRILIFSATPPHPSFLPRSRTTGRWIGITTQSRATECTKSNRQIRFRAESVHLIGLLFSADGYLTGNISPPAATSRSWPHTTCNRQKREGRREIANTMRAFYIPTTGPARFVHVAMPHPSENDNLPLHTKYFPQGVRHRTFVMPSGVRVLVYYDAFDYRSSRWSVHMAERYALTWSGDLMIFRVRHDDNSCEDMNPETDNDLAWDASRYFVDEFASWPGYDRVQRLDGVYRAWTTIDRCRTWAIQVPSSRQKRDEGCRESGFPTANNEDCVARTGNADEERGLDRVASLEPDALIQRTLYRTFMFLSDRNRVRKGMDDYIGCIYYGDGAELIAQLLGWEIGVHRGWPHGAGEGRVLSRIDAAPAASTDDADDA